MMQIVELAKVYRQLRRLGFIAIWTSCKLEWRHHFWLSVFNLIMRVYILQPHLCRWLLNRAGFRLRIEIIFQCASLN